MASTGNSFGARGTLEVRGKKYEVYRLEPAASALGLALDRLPLTLRVLLENLLRNEDGRKVTREIAIHGVGSERPALLYSMIVLYQPPRS